jgi:ribosomal protein S18 acetylase RimI-like enzyme
MAVITEQDCVHLAEIALLPDERNHGIGTALISGVLGEARSRGAPVQLRVLRNNRACRLYERLGFLIMADNGIHLSMEWRPVAG